MKRGVVFLLVVCLALSLAASPAQALGDNEARWLSWLLPIGGALYFQHRNAQEYKRSARRQAAAAEATKDAEEKRGGFWSEALGRLQQGKPVPINVVEVEQPQAAESGEVIRPVESAGSMVTQDKLADQATFMLLGSPGNPTSWGKIEEKEALLSNYLLIGIDPLPMQVTLARNGQVIKQWQGTGVETQDKAIYNNSLYLEAKDLTAGDEIVTTAVFADRSIGSQKFVLGPIEPVINQPEESDQSDQLDKLDRLDKSDSTGGQAQELEETAVEQNVFKLLAWSKGQSGWTQDPADPLAFQEVLITPRDFRRQPVLVKIKTGDTEKSWEAPTRAEGETEENYIVRAKKSYYEIMAFKSGDLARGQEIFARVVFADGAVGVREIIL